MRGIRILLVFGVASACGDDSGSARVDAASDEDAPTVDIDAPMQAACDFTEANDAGNDLISTAEATGLTLATKLTLCGKVDSGHFNTGTELVDADGFKFTLAADADILVHIAGTGLASVDDTVLQIRKQGSAPFYGFGIVEGTHGTIATRLAAGDWVIATGTFNTTAPAAAIDYKITVTPDAPATRCPQKTGTATHPEGSDGGNNDVVSYATTQNPESRLTNSGGDSPETTGITVAPANSYLITGDSASVDAHSDDYLDRDTFAFTTGTSTTQMTVRLNWASTTADFDFRVYPESTNDPLSIVGGLDISDSELEFETFAVKPSTTYWLWVALGDSSTAPATYAATLCGETFSP